MDVLRLQTFNLTKEQGTRDKGQGRRGFFTKIEETFQVNRDVCSEMIVKWSQLIMMLVICDEQEIFIQLMMTNPDKSLCSGA
jgi:hypothetical protein